MNPVQQLLADLQAGALSAEDLAARIAALTDEELAEFEGAASDVFDAIRSGDAELPEDADAFEVLERLVDSVEAVRNDAAARMQQAADDDARVDALEDRLRPVAETEPDGAGAGGDGDTPPEGEPAPADAPPADAPADAPPEGEPAPADAPPADAGAAAEPVAVPAGAAPRPAPRISRIQSRVRPDRQPRPSQSQQAPAVMTAAAEVPGYSAGQTLRSLEELAEVMVARAEPLRGMVVDEGVRASYNVARITAAYPEDRQLTRNADLNQERITAAFGPNNETIVSMTAAGGLCAPPTPLYDQITIAADDRPARGALPSFGAARGGILFMPPPRLGDYVAGGRKWTVTNDVEALTNADVRKPCVRVDCDDTVEEQVYARTKCLTVGNFFARTYDERVQAIIRLMGAEQAREAERDLLDKMGDESTNLSGGQLLGTTRDVLAHLDLVVASFRNRHRVPDGFMLELWFPRWLRDNIRADLVRALASSGSSLQENLAAADTTIATFFAQRNVSVTWLWDGERGSGQDFGAPADGGLLGNWPTRVVGYVFHPGAWMFLDMGTLDLGVVRDSTLNATNDLQIWSETWEGLAFRGLESQRISLDICPDGSQSGTVDIDPCTTGS